MPRHKIPINRAPVLTLWAAVVAERLGYDREAALTLGRGLAGLNAQSKGQRLGIYEKKTEKPAARESKPEKAAGHESVELMGREIPSLKTPQGLRAESRGQAIEPASVQAYLQQKFGDDLEAARTAMEKLARTYSPAQLATVAFSLYEKFRPEIPEGKKGWGAKGELDLDRIVSLAK